MTTLPLPAGLLLLLSVAACFLSVARAQRPQRQCLPDQPDVGGLNIQYGTRNVTYNQDFSLSAIGFNAPTVTATGVENNVVLIEKTVISYAPPSPPPGTGPHRYQFILYPLNKVVSDFAIPDDRDGFLVDNFVSSLALDNPTAVASFQFTAEN